MSHLGRAARGILCAALFVLAASGCAPIRTADDAEIVVIGDSVLAWNRNRGASVAALLAVALDAPVADRARSGASLLPGGSSFFGGSIQRQVPDGPRSVIVTNGGANDLNTLCGCDACDAVMDALVSADGSEGAWVDHVANLRGRARQVVIVGYYGPSRAGPGGFAACTDDLIELDARLARLAARTPSVAFASPRSAMGGEPANYDGDRTHPSPRGSGLIAGAVLPLVEAVLRSPVLPPRELRAGPIAGSTRRGDSGAPGWTIFGKST